MKFPVLTNVLTNVGSERGGKVRKKEENICQGKKMKGDEIVDFIAFLAGALGIEPRTRGFGDRCSTG